MRQATSSTTHSTARYDSSALLFQPCSLLLGQAFGLANTTNIQAAAGNQALTGSPDPGHAQALSRNASRGPRRKDSLSRASLSQLAHAGSCQAEPGRQARAHSVSRSQAEKTS